MPAGTLTGYGLKILGLRFEHTYVESTHGHVWPCWGRSAGGRTLCAGIGNTDHADCLSLPNSQAGVIYGVTGVCHQTANRILYPSGQTVSNASGYRGSLFAWEYMGEILPLFNTTHPPACHGQNSTLAVLPIYTPK
jgi:hypothetical protein